MNIDTEKKPRWWARGATWRAAGVIVVIVVAGIEHRDWRGMKPWGLHLIPALTLGLVLLWAMDGLIAFARGTACPPRVAWRWLTSRETWLGFAQRVAFLATLVVLFYSVEFWRGRRAWASVEKEATRRGIDLGQRGALVEQVPDEQNFAKAPLFAPLHRVLERRVEFMEDLRSEDLLGLARIKPWQEAGFGRTPRGPKPMLAAWTLGHGTDFNLWLKSWPGATESERQVQRDVEEPPEKAAAAGVVLERLQSFDAEIEQLRQYAGRPYCRFPLDYPRQMLLEDHAHQILSGYLRIMGLRAAALLATGRDQDALADVQLALRLIDHSRQQPWAVFGLMRMGIYIDTLQPVWEGLRKQCWTDDELILLQRQLEGLDLLSDYAVHVHNDAVGMADLHEAFLPTRRDSQRVPKAERRDPELQGLMTAIRLAYPTGWSLLDQAAMHRFHLDWTSGLIDLTTRTSRQHQPTPSILWRGTSDPFFPVFIAPKLRTLSEDAAVGYPAVQTALDQAVVACALERCRRADGRYPESLTELAPRFLKQLPHDIMTGNPWIYRRTDSGFTLYSVGGNRVDDGGVPSGRQSWGFLDLTSGDWVWAMDSSARPARTEP
jgi:hypothetical protein